MTDALSIWIVDAHVPATILLLIAFAAMAAIRRPSRRLAVAGATLGGLIVPLAAAALPGWPRSSPVGRPSRSDPAPASARVPAPSAPPLGVPAPASATPRAIPPARPEPRAIPPGPAPDLRAIAARAFAAGSTVAVGWLALGAWRLAALRRGSRRAPAWAEDALARLAAGARPPALLVSDDIRQPAAFGALRPAIALPSRFLDEPPDRLEAALAHEWAHVRNGDPRRLALSRLLLPALFAHPLYWLLRARIRADQEALADASAAAVAGRLEYAEALLAWSRSAPRGPRIARGGSVALFGRPSRIKRRIAALLDAESPVEPSCPARWRLASRAIVAAAALAASLPTLRPPAAAAPAPAPPAADEGGRERVARILGPDGSPFAGAKVHRTAPAGFFDLLGAGRSTSTFLGETGPDGLVRYPSRSSGLGWRHEWIVATAEGLGPAFVDPREGAERVDARLVPDDAPIRGRVIDLRGRPVADAEVAVARILWMPDESAVDAWIEGLKKRNMDSARLASLRAWIPPTDPIPLPPPARTDADGRFVIRGAGRERVVELRVSGEALRTSFETVATRAMAPITRVVIPEFDEIRTLHGASCEFVAETGTVAAGTVVDEADGRPIAGARVWFGMGPSEGAISTSTDRRGRYRLEGLPPRRRPVSPEQARADVLNAERRGDESYPTMTLPLIPADGARPIRLDFRMRREGR